MSTYPNGARPGRPAAWKLGRAMTRSARITVASNLLRALERSGVRGAQLPLLLERNVIRD